MLYKDQRKSGGAVSQTSDAAEIAKFNALADEWWKPDGKFTVVHRFNAARVAYLRAHLAAALRPEAGPRIGDTEAHPLTGLKIADIGCGAGLVSEPLARAGAEVFAIDAAERNVAIATRHAETTGVSGIRYMHALPEDLGDEHEKAYDAVLSLEVVEHVADVGGFLRSAAALVRPGGVLVIGTLNRTPKSFAFGIVGAEYVMRLLPRGTHDWRKFVKPGEIEAAVREDGFVTERIVGVSVSPLDMHWSITDDRSVNYLATLRRSAVTA